MATKRQKWATNRNWLIRRLRGTQSIFSGINCKFMSELIPRESWMLINTISIGIGQLIDEVSKSKYKE